VVVSTLERARSCDRVAVVPVTCPCLVRSAGRGRFTVRAAREASRDPRPVALARQAAFRDAVLAAAEYRCQAIEHGIRCDVTDPPLLDAHHLKRLCDGGTNDTSNGVCLCRHHDRKVEAASPSRST
jgi:predicted restriction endonuclease